MTRSRIFVDREIVGLLGSVPSSPALLRAWNGRFKRLGMNATMERYPCTEHTLHERLSEMLHFDRRGYIVDSSLQSAIVPLLDGLDGVAVEEGRADTVWNMDGVLRGAVCENDDDARFALWFSQQGRR